MPPSSIRYDDEALIAEPLHNTFYVTDMVDYTVINDDKTHHHDNLSPQTAGLLSCSDEVIVPHKNAACDSGQRFNSKYLEEIAMVLLAFRIKELWPI